MSGDESDSDAVEELSRRFASDWDSDLNTAYRKLLAPTAAQQCKFRSDVENIDNILRTGTDAPEVQTASDNLFDALISTMGLGKPETPNIPTTNPRRDTIIFTYSGSHFSAGPKAGIEKLLIEQKYTKYFKTFMQTQLTQDIEAININSIIGKSFQLSPEERHCLAKYLLFVMSVCENEKLVDTIHETLLNFANSLTLGLNDFVDVFNNWGIPKELLYPPFAMNASTPSAKSSPESNFQVAEYNVFKVLDFINTMMLEEKGGDLKSRLTVVRVLIMIWLDKRFAVSWKSYKFGNHIASLVDGIDTDGGTADDVLRKTLDFSEEHMHNQAWIIKKLLEGNTASMRQVGRHVGTQFLLQTFHRGMVECPILSLCQLYDILTSEVQFLSELDIYSAHIKFLVIETYVTTYDTSAEDKNIIEKLTEWCQTMYMCYSDDCHSEIYDRHIIMRQLDNLSIRLQRTLDDYSNPEVWEDPTLDDEMNYEDED